MLMKINSARFVICTGCYHQFIICSYCDRGNIYCGANCSSLARKKFQKDAGKRYQASLNGKLHHAARQSRYRARKNKVTHHTSKQQSSYVSLSVKTNNQTLLFTQVLAENYCCFCGKPCLELVRVNFLQKSSSNKKRNSSLQPQAP
jgi:uncharacterized lipoprotein YehR (DUF1307 family)